MVDEPDMTAPDTETRASWRDRLSVAASVLIWGLFYTAAWQQVGPHLLYRRFRPVFLATTRFLTDHLDRPGGVAAYLAAFLDQFNLYPWVGALALTLVGWLLFLATRQLLGTMSQRRIHPAFACLAPLVMLMLCERYDWQMVAGVSVLIAVASVNLYTCTAARRTPLRLVTFIGLSIVVYYLAGGACVLFGVLSGLWELMRRRRVLAGVFCVLCGAALPWLYAMSSFTTDVLGAYRPLHPFRREFPAFANLFRLTTGLHLLLPIVLVLTAIVAGLTPWVAGLWSRIRRRTSDAAATPLRPPRWSLISLPVFLALAAVLVAATFDREAGRNLRIRYDVDRDQWSDALKTASELDPRYYDFYVQLDVKLALYHAGRLADDMFSFLQTTQPSTVGFVPDQRSGSLEFARLLFELGHVNKAQMVAQVDVETHGSQPEALKLLAFINLLKGRERAARTFLAELRKNPLYAAWVDRLCKRLDADPLLKNDPELQRLRAVMATRDYGYGGFGDFPFEELLEQQVRTNPHNRMAFEYLMAHWLSTLQVERVVANLGRLDDLDVYRDIPRHYEEAILVYENLNPGRRVNLAGRRIRETTLKRWQDFLADLARWKNTSGQAKEDALRTLVEDYGNTFFFYYQFGYTEPRPGWRLGQVEAATGATR